MPVAITVTLETRTELALESLRNLTSPSAGSRQGARFSHRHQGSKAPVMAEGVATLILGIGAHNSLAAIRTRYYEANGFASLTCTSNT